MEFEQAREGESTQHNLAYKGRFAVGVPMNDREALEAFNRGEKLDQPTIKRLYQEGLIEASDVTHLQSDEQELLPTLITEKGRRILEGR